MIKIMHFCSDSNVGGAGITLYRLLSNSDKSTFEHYVVLPYDSALIALFSKSKVTSPKSPEKLCFIFYSPLKLELYLQISRIGA